MYATQWLCHVVLVLDMLSPICLQSEVTVIAEDMIEFLLPLC